MSGLELIPIVTGIVCAVGAAKSLMSGKKNDRSRAGRNRRDGGSYRDGRHSMRSRSRGRSSSRTSRTMSLSRDTPHSVAFRWKSRSQSRWSDSRSERSRSKPPRSRRSSPKRRSSRGRRCRSSSRDGQRPRRRSYERLDGDDQIRRLTMPLTYDEAPRLGFCKGRVDRRQVTFLNGRQVREMYVCNGCNLEIVEPGIASWHRFSPRDRGEVTLHKDFILRSHEAQDGKLGCMLCGKWMTGYKRFVSHLSKHRYTDLVHTIPQSEWKGSKDGTSPGLRSMYNQSARQASGCAPMRRKVHFDQPRRHF